MKIWQPIFFLFVSFALCVTPSQGDEPTFAIAIHGGSGGKPLAMDAETKAAFEAAMEEALNKGKAILEEGGTSMDAVQQVISQLEDHPIFNAGKGAVCNVNGNFELDASCLLYTSPSPRDQRGSRMPSSA